MGAQGQDHGGGYASEINITPLVDVVLVLLIIFMVIVPVMMRGYDVSIPGEARVAPSTEERAKQIVLHIDDAGCAIVEPPDGPGLPAGCVVYPAGTRSCTRRARGVPGVQIVYAG